MKAGRAYRLIVTRGGRAPALLADPARVDHIEVVEIDSGEVVLFWDRPPQAASGSRGRCAPTWRGWRRRSSWRAGVPWSLMPIGQPPARRDSRRDAREWLEPR